MTPPFCITCEPGDLDQGLFGQVLPNVLQILPYLHQNGLYPAWKVRSLHYADSPQFITLPGVFDVAYEAPRGVLKEISLNELRRRHSQVLGSDWRELSRIWTSYFSVPQRTIDRLAEYPSEGQRLLGVHYRGTDKQTASWDSNPISQEQYLILLQDFLSQQPGFDRVIAATDEHGFVDKLQAAVKIPVTYLGAVDFHLAASRSGTRAEKADRALLDCLLLSKCSVVIETSSALPSFAKLFSPDIQIYRCAASRVFSNMPYFPVAFIPVLPVTTELAKDILSKTMLHDWTTDGRMQRFKHGFTFVPRWPRNHAWFSAAERLGLDQVLARWMQGYR